MKSKNPYLGKWRIVEMELWDQDYIDIETDGYFSFDKDNLGAFHFGVVQGQVDYRIEKCGGSDRIEFSWYGQEEYDEVSGRGWAVIKKDQIEGRLYFHLGDDSWFKARESKYPM